jgi:predicted Zn-dependent protease
MQRRAFVRSLIAAVGVSQLTHVTAALALDEGAIGRQVFLALQDDGEILFDSPYYEHLNEVGRIISTSVKDRYPYPIRFYIVKGESANAFSVPGGNIYVNEPLLRLATNRDELGGVLAHETGHMVLHHVAQRIKNQNVVGGIGTIGQILGQIFLGPIASIGSSYALDTAMTAQDLNISRHIEAQADEEGARIAAATNELNPYGLIWFFRRMTEVYGSKGSLWLRSHPFDEARIADLENLFASAPQTFGKFESTDKRDVAYW